MDFTLKAYKRFKIKVYLKKKKFFFFFHGTSLKSENWIKIEQTLVNQKIKYSRILNKLMIYLLKKSIFNNLITLTHGPIILLRSNSIELAFSKLENINPFIYLLGVILNHKIYYKKQIKNLKNLSYLKNVLILYNTIKTFTKRLYYNLKSTKKS